ncbi:unnamed protein product [Calypogeia fissa]
MGWRYKIGLLLIASVVLIWVTSAEVTQSIFKAYRHPFVLTWLGASLLVVYLPVSIVRETVWKCVKGALKGPKDHFEGLNGYTPTIITESPGKSPLRNGLRKGSDLELHHFARKDSDLDVEGEEARFLLQSPAAQHGSAKVHGWDLVKIGFILAPLWFLTEYLSNAALALTSVASTTILSSTAGLFTLAFGTVLGQDSFNFTKGVAVVVSILGVAMTTLGKTWSTDAVELADVNNAQHSLWGDLLGLLSAVSYGIFTILLKKYAGEEGSRVDMQKMFGYIGLFSLCAMWWLVWPLSWIGLEPDFSIPSELKTDEVLLANAILGSVLSDYFWAMSVVWTTPLVATLGMSLTIPLAMVADMMVHGRHFSAIYILGSIQVFAGFVIANITDQCSRKFGL